MARVSSQTCTFVCANMSPALRRVLTAYLVEVAPLTFVGRLSTRVREKLWEELVNDFPEHKVTLIIPTSQNEQGFLVSESDKASSYITDIDGLTVSVRRSIEPERWELLLGKTLPFDYPVALHLVDTAAVAAVLWDEVITDQQKVSLCRLISAGVEDKPELVRNLILVCAGLHDIGKATPDWLRGTIKMKTGHPSLSGRSLPEEASDDYRKHEENGRAYFIHGGSILTGEVNRKLLDALGHITRSHHGTFAVKKDVPEGYERKYMPWVDDQRSIETMILRVLGVAVEELSVITAVQQTAQLLISGIVTLADWIASSEDFILAMPVNNNNYDSHFIAAKSKAESFVEHYGLAKATWDESFTIQSVFSDFPPNPLQSSLAEYFDSHDGQGITFISAPMGSGKTEASLYAASTISRRAGGSGFWITLPTQSTTDLMFSRAKDVGRRVFEEGSQYSVSLMHANAAFSNAIDGIGVNAVTESISDNISMFDDDAEDKKDKQSGSFISSFLVEKKLGGMSSISVSTIDQLINSATKLKHNTLRWLTLSGKTVVIDEIHDFSPYTFELIKRFVSWCGTYGIPVIAMSATLSGASQKKLIEAYYPDGNQIKPASLIDAIPSEGISSPGWIFASSDGVTTHYEDALPKEDYQPYETSLSVSSGFLDAVIPLVKEHDENGASTLVVCHTINQATATYRELKALNLDSDVVLLHSRMAMERKQELVAEIVSRTSKGGTDDRKPLVVVSTQIVQQSMDIDFDVLISPLAPLPALLQRVGRVYRHNQGSRRAVAYDKRPRVHIIVHPGMIHEDTDTEGFGNSVIPYSEWELRSTLVVLQTQEISEQPSWWNPKAETSRLFLDHFLVSEDARNERADERLNVSYREFIAAENNESYQGENSSISMPPNSRSFMLDGVTSGYTSRSYLAAPTRLFSESVSILPTWQDAHGERFIDEDKRVVVPTHIDVQSKRLVASKMVSASQQFLGSLSKDLDGLIVEVEGVPEHVTCIDVSSLSPIAVYGDEEGLGLVDFEGKYGLWL